MKNVNFRTAIALIKYCTQQFVHSTIFRNRKALLVVVILIILALSNKRVTAQWGFFGNNWRIYSDKSTHLDFVNGTMRMRIRNNGVVDFYNNITVSGADIHLNYEGRRINDSGSRRALVHFERDELHVNFEGDYPGGTRIGSHLWVKNNGTLHGKGPIQLYGDASATKPGTAYIRAKDNSATTSIGIHLNTQNKGKEVNALIIKPNGAIGIGTATPRKALEVKGSILTDSIFYRYRSGTYPDYVFDENYHLTPLAELESFIKKNRHLPGVPSENEASVQGVELVSFNHLLLEKIEELTLYTLQQQKLILGLQQEIQLLKTTGTK